MELSFAGTKPLQEKQRTVDRKQKKREYRTKGCIMTMKENTAQGD